MKAQSETRAIYAVTPASSPDHTDDEIIEKARAILAARLRKPGEALTTPASVKDFLRLNLAQSQHEIFAVIWLDAQNRLIEYQELFAGTLTQTSVHPREAVKAALACNAGACILAHNHPSGFAEPSNADQALTRRLRDALALVDCRVLDHFIVGGADVMSFAERGLI